MAEESSRLLDNSEQYRKCSLTFNSCGYTKGNEYCTGHEDTISDGDCRGRDPEANGNAIGTICDIKMRDKLMGKNSDGYTKGNEYCIGHEDTISDGDCRGRNPEANGSAIGTTCDIEMRNKLLAKNRDRYTKEDEYCSGHEDTIADGDNRGRDPESQGSCIGTACDIQKRTGLSARNIYNSGNEYCSANA